MRRHRRIAFALLGFSAFGAALAANVGAILTPLACALALASLLPLLYITATLFGIAPPLREVIAVARGAFEDTGIAMLGLAPAAAFLRPVAPWLVIVPGIMLATRIAAIAFSRRLPEHTLFIRTGVGAWMCVVSAMSLSFLDKWM